MPPSPQPIFSAKAGLIASSKLPTNVETMSLGSGDVSELGGSTLSLESDDLDASEEPTSSEYILFPWRTIKKKVQARATGAINSGNVLSTTIPHGFQQSRALPHQRPTVRSAIYIPGIPDRVVSVDSHHVNVWKNETKVSSIPLVPQPKAPRSALAGLTKWLYVSNLKGLFIATAQLEIKLLNPLFEEITSVSSAKPVQSLEFVEAENELITGGVGTIRVWKLKKSVDLATPYRFDGCRLTIGDLHEEDWVSHTVHSAHNNQLYAGIAVITHQALALKIYDYKTGERLETMKDVHELSITAMTIFEPFGLLITASLKIFNRQNNLLHRLHEHTHSVSGIQLLPLPDNKTGLAALATTPFFLSCSLDGTVRMWDADMGVCVYCLQTPSECLGLQWMKGDSFLHYAKDRISVWNLNRFYTSFTHTRSPVTQLQRIHVPNRPARILSVAEDGSLRILSPVSGVMVTIGFPVMEDIKILASVYDPAKNRAWLLLDNGDLAVYSTQTNPCEILDETKHAPGHARICCMTALSALGPVTNAYDVSTSNAPAVYGLWGGCDAGQIVLVDIRDPSRQESIVQAHAGEITSIVWDESRMRLFTSGKDRVVKVWSVSVPANSCLATILPKDDQELGTRGAGEIIMTGWDNDSAPVSLRLTLVATVGVTDGCVTRMAWGACRDRLAVATDTNRVFMVNVSGSAGSVVKQHARDDEHTRTVTGLAANAGTGVVASGSDDGTVKIWDGIENVLLREIQFAYPVSSVCFANPRGDLLVGLPDELVAVRIEDYLPGPQLRAVMDGAPWADDILEDPYSFDSGLDFWSLYRGADNSGATWHVAKPETPVPNELVSTDRDIQRVEKQLEEQIEALELEQQHHLRARVIREESISSSTGTMHLLGTTVASRIASRRASREQSILNRRPSYGDTLLLWGNTMGPGGQLGGDVKWAGFEKPSLWDEGDEDEDDVEQHPARRGPRSNKLGNRQILIQEAHHPRHSPTNESIEFAKVAKIRRGGVSAMGVQEEDEKCVGDTSKKRSNKGSLEELRSGEPQPNQPGAQQQPQAGEPGDAEMISANQAVQLDSSHVGKEDGSAPQTPQESGRQRKGSRGERGREIPTMQQAQAAAAAQIARRAAPVKESVPKPLVAKAKPGVIPTAPSAVPVAPNSAAPAAASSTLTAEEQAAERQAQIRRGMERLGILPNSMVAGQTPSILTLKKQSEERARKEKDKAMLENARALVMRRRAAERAARIAAGGAIDMLLEEDEEEEAETPEKKAKKEEGVRRLKREMSDRDARYQIGQPVMPSVATITESTKTANGEEEAPSSAVASPAAVTGTTPPIAPTEPESSQPATPSTPSTPTAPARRVPPENLPETRKAVFHKRANFSDVTIAGVLTVIAPDDTGVVSVDYRSEQRPIPLQIIHAPTPPPRAMTPISRSSSGARAGAHQDVRPDSSSEGLTRVIFERRNGNHERGGTPPAIIKPHKVPSAAHTDLLPKEHRVATPPQPFPYLQEVKFSVHDHPGGVIKKELPVGPQISQEVVLEKIVPELQGILTAFWFPGMGGREINFANVMQVLFEVLKTGYWSEKAEASDALLLLFLKFKDEFRDPLQDFIMPQIESLSDRDWQTRLRLCQNLVKYGVYAAPLIQALMARLVDEHVDVRKAAMHSLAHFGIDTTHALRSAMQQLNMLPSRPTGPRESWLDILLARLRARQRAAEAESIRQSQKWLSAMTVYSPHRSRPPSSYVTLVPPPDRTQGDGVDFVMPTFPDPIAVAAARKMGVVGTAGSRMSTRMSFAGNALPGTPAKRGRRISLMAAD
ncbi:hypothetical protein PhCBS80983_g00223 [Powellomyces hirtus]|uniref:WD40 repeat-like protein n=1 Tax=Powellomyces hirtus TaxID=109895 RepID=A0A507EGJ5_9FUNG|nr:hypothetical protein PhCBS80983_g00223 [Powellomyces hirtus]